MPRLLGPDPDLPTVFSRDAAVAAGLSDDQIAYRIRVGRWERLAPGRYRRADRAPNILDEHARLRLEHVHRSVLAVQRNPGAVLGFESAALVHGLPISGPPPALVTLVVPPGSWTGIRHGIRFRQGVVSSHDLSPHRIAVTGATRTWTDIARTMRLADALVTGDAGLRAGLFDHGELTDAVANADGKRGCRRAAAALECLDGRRESPLESQSVAYFIDRRIEVPEPQVEIRSVAGRFIARVDVLWRRARLVGECDGRLKYATPDDLYAEKRREDAIRAEGYRVVRWGAADLRTDALALRVRRALA